MPTSTVEDYLKCIQLEGQRRPDEMVSTGQIAEALEVAPGTVTSMIKTLFASGLVVYEPYGGVQLTEAGQQLALRVLRRHRLIELFLVQVMGMDWSEVHAEAELLEHAVSDQLVERMDEMLGRPGFDPHGDPIPTVGGVVADPELVNLLVCDVGTAVMVGRLDDQDPSFLQLAERNGLKPGSLLEVVSREEAADSVLLKRPDRENLSLGFRAARKILVTGA